MLQSTLLLFLAIFLVFLNGFFVLSEFAIVKVRRSRLEELAKANIGNANLALQMSHKLDSYLSATQLGVTLSSLALGWIGEPAVAKLLEVPFKYIFEGNKELISIISFVIAFTAITLAHVVMGELIPKSIAIAKSEQAVLIVAKPLHMFAIIFYPLIKIFDKLAAFFLQRMGIYAAGEHETAHTEEELKFIVGESLKGGVIDSVEEEIIKNAVNFSDTTAKEVMTPRKDIICLNSEDSYEENLNVIRNTRHTRYPYCNGDKDQITGMLHIRDILENELSKNPVRDLSKLIRQMIVIPETASIASVLMKMNRRQIHTAIVIDEYGGTAGLLSMEDIIEEIMGDISDEHDSKHAEEYNKVGKNVFDFDGMIAIENAFEKIDKNVANVKQVTLGGYVFNLFGRLPSIGDTVEDDVCRYEILKMDGARIKKIRAYKMEETNKEWVEG